MLLSKEPNQYNLQRILKGFQFRSGSRTNSSSCMGFRKCVPMSLCFLSSSCWDILWAGEPVSGNGVYEMQRHMGGR